MLMQLANLLLGQPYPREKLTLKRLREPLRNGLLFRPGHRGSSRHPEQPPQPVSHRECVPPDPTFPVARAATFVGPQWTVLEYGKTRNQRGYGAVQSRAADRFAAPAVRYSRHTWFLSPVWSEHREQVPRRVLGGPSSRES